MAPRGTWVRPHLTGAGLKMQMSLPHDLTKLTAGQVESCVAYHSAMPLSKIRRWQELVDEQIGMAWQQRNDFALNNLRVMEDLLRRGAERKLPPLDASRAKRQSPRLATVMHRGRRVLVER